jgi:hypothetical protein
MWFKVDDGFHSSRKLLQIPKRQRWAAEGLWVHAGSWAGDNLTDGHIPDYIIAEWAPPPSAVEALVKVGLWDRTHGGFDFRNWAEYQPSREDVEVERAANRARQKAFRDRLKHQKHRDHAEAGHASRVTVTENVTAGNALVIQPDPTRPEPTRPKIKDSSKTDEEFDQWYSRYPRKEAKTAARKAFAKARKDVDMDTLMVGLTRYVASVKGRERQYIALPASWLNAGRWEDDYTPLQHQVPSMYAHFNN